MRIFSRKLKISSTKFSFYYLIFFSEKILEISLYYLIKPFKGPSYLLTPWSVNSLAVVGARPLVLQVLAPTTTRLFTDRGVPRRQADEQTPNTNNRLIVFNHRKTQGPWPCACQIIDVSSLQTINSSIQPINLSTHRFNPSIHQPIKSSTLEF